MFKYLPPMALALIGIIAAGPFGGLAGLLIWVVMELVIEPNKPKKSKK